MTASEFFGTLQDSITAEWRKHLEADNHDVHVILDEFYKEMPELVDALIEAWQAEHDKVEDYSNTLEVDDQLNAYGYLKVLKTFVKNGRKELLNGESELESLCDDILAQIDSTMYKLKDLTKIAKEGLISLTQFIKENLDNNINERKTSGAFDKEVNISMKDFELLKKEYLSKKYEVFYNEENQLYTFHEKADGKYMVGAHIGTYVCKTGKLFYASNGPLTKIIDRYIK